MVHPLRDAVKPGSQSRDPFRGIDAFAYAMTDVSEPSPVKIGVISDTHLQGPHPRLEEIAEDLFCDADLILHAGDLTSLTVLDVFRGKEVIAVAGNNDPPEVKRRLPVKRLISANGLRIGLIHGWGLPLGLPRKITPLFRGADCIVFGHSHWARNYRKNGILYFNPGAFCGGISSLWQRSVGLLEIQENIQGQVIRL